jgi:hypothetical protein
MKFEVWRHYRLTIMSEDELRQWAVDYWRFQRDQANEVLTTLHDISYQEIVDLMEGHELASINIKE